MFGDAVRLALCRGHAGDFAETSSRKRFAANTTFQRINFSWSTSKHSKFLAISTTTQFHTTRFSLTVRLSARRRLGGAGGTGGGGGGAPAAPSPPPPPRPVPALRGNFSDGVWAHVQRVRPRITNMSPQLICCHSEYVAITKMCPTSASTRMPMSVRMSGRPRLLAAGRWW